MHFVHLKIMQYSLLLCYWNSSYVSLTLYFHLKCNIIICCFAIEIPLTYVSLTLYFQEQNSQYSLLLCYWNSSYVSLTLYFHLKYNNIVCCFAIEIPLTYVSLTLYFQEQIRQVMHETSINGDLLLEIERLRVENEKLRFKYWKLLSFLTVFTLQLASIIYDMTRLPCMYFKRRLGCYG